MKLVTKMTVYKGSTEDLEEAQRLVSGLNDCDLKLNDSEELCSAIDALCAQAGLQQLKGLQASGGNGKADGSLRLRGQKDLCSAIDALCAKACLQTSESLEANDKIDGEAGGGLRLKSWNGLRNAIGTLCAKPGLDSPKDSEANTSLSCLVGLFAAVRSAFRNRAPFRNRVYSKEGFLLKKRVAQAT